MERRFLNALLDHEGRPGAFATKWEGWVNPRHRATLDGLLGTRINKSRAEGFIDKVESQMGVYVFLYKAGEESFYVCYVGRARELLPETKKMADYFKMWRDPQMLITAVYISNQKMCEEYEDDLIRYYCPPWNKKFHK